ncbi:hypothetical protein LTR84_002151 [Exophiala bonariae]|uniref:GAF domain-containing protein n=1 Tax=Exophiala bonariae TaxID=1690606 RepID=A0AAV9NEF7_9EURO|nr:hypothetical protein LTR84_002151 [Exophiala bonariae]
MPHADASNFSPTLSKSEAYEQLISSLTALLIDQRNWVANTANTASLLWHLYHSFPSTSPSSAVNWAGFYVLDPTDPAGQLILGPFMGKVACQTIRIGRGVCGAAAQGTGRTVLVKDVEAFPGHIACDGDSRSEIVVPIRTGGKVVGVIDIDCAELEGFDEEDQKSLEAIADLLGKSSDW